MTRELERGMRGEQWKGDGGVTGLVTLGSCHS